MSVPLARMVLTSSSTVMVPSNDPCTESRPQQARPLDEVLLASAAHDDGTQVQAGSVTGVGNEDAREQPPDAPEAVQHDVGTATCLGRAASWRRARLGGTRRACARHRASSKSLSSRARSSDAGPGPSVCRESSTSFVCSSGSTEPVTWCAYRCALMTPIGDWLIRVRPCMEVMTPWSQVQAADERDHLLGEGGGGFFAGLPGVAVGDYVFGHASTVSRGRAEIGPAPPTQTVKIRRSFVEATRRWSHPSPLRRRSPRRRPCR